MTAVGIALTARSRFPASAMVAAACAAEEAGFGSVLITDTRSDICTSLGALATTTRSIILGTGIANVFLRPPLLLSMSLAAVDELSGQRLLVGLGTGDRRVNHDWFGCDWQSPAAYVADYIGALRAIWQPSPVNYDGKYFHIKDAELASLSCRSIPPVFVAVSGPLMRRVAVTVGDGLILNMAPERYIRQTVDEARATAETEGRPAPRVMSYLMAYIGLDGEQAARSARRVIAYYCALDNYNRMFRDAGFAEEAEAIRSAWLNEDHDLAASLVTRAMVDQVAVIGDRDDLAERIHRLEELGVTDPVIYPNDIDGDWQRPLESVLSAQREQRLGTSRA